MREPGFWQRGGMRARLLAPAAAVYGAIAASRMRRGGAHAEVPVVCIGNFTVGGAGKTPTAITVARLLAVMGAHPVFLTRGYGGALSGPVQVEACHTAAEVGDEPLLLARVAPTIVAHDRVAGAQAAARLGSIIVMDDGFQNPSLAKDLSIVVLDSDRGIGNGRVIPAGPLRAPLAGQIALADAVLLVGRPGPPRDIREAQGEGLPVVRALLEPDPQTVAALAGKPVLAFAGIGYPKKFFATLTAAGVRDMAVRVFADHHRYTAGEARRLLASAAREHRMLVTTEKDLARLAGRPELAELADATVALPVAMVIQDEAPLRMLLRRVL